MDARTRLAVLSLAAALITSTDTTRAEAPEPPICTPPFLLTERAIPRNAQGFRVAGGGSDLPDVTVRRVGDGALLNATFIEPSFVRVGADLLEGEELAIELRDDCAARERPVHARLRVGPAVPLPTALGTARVGPLEAGDIPLPPSSGCMDSGLTLGVYRAIELAADPSSQPWSDFMRISVSLDGRDSGGDGVAPLGEGFMLYARCDGEVGGLAPGDHQVSIRAVSQALGIALQTPEAAVDLRCTDGVLALAAEHRAADARRQFWRRVERTLLPLLPYGVGLALVLSGVLVVRRRRKRKPAWPHDVE